jgi:ankyrin repeat protein
MKHGYNFRINLLVILCVVFVLVLCPMTGQSKEAVTLETDVKIRYADGKTPLHRAVNNPELAQKMISLGADVNARDNLGKTPLFVAVEHGATSLQSIPLLLKNKANPNLATNFGMTPLHCAIVNKNLKALKFLLQSNVNLDPEDNVGNTPLNTAIAMNVPDFAEILVTAGADPWHKSETMAWPIQYAVSRGYAGLVKLMIAKSDLQKRDSSGNTLLHLCAIKDNFKLCELLVENGADANAKNDQGLTALQLAKNYNPSDSDLINYLANRTKAKSDFNDCGIAIENTDNRDLHSIIRRGKLDDLRQMLSGPNSFNVNVQDVRGDTPLHVAIEEKNCEAVKLILNYRPDLNIENNLNLDPLTLSVEISESNNPDIVKVLLKNGANANRPGYNENTPLHTAVICRKVQFVRILLDSNANPNRRNKYGQTPLHVAVETREYESVKALLQKNANLDLLDNSGISPRMLVDPNDNHMLKLITRGVQKLNSC